MAGLAIAYCVPGVDERWQNAGAGIGKKANIFAAGRTGIARKRCGCFSLKARAVIQIEEEQGEFPLVELPMPPREEEAPASSSASPGRSITVSSSPVTDSEDSSDRFVIRNNREIYQEKAFLVGVEMKRTRTLFSIDESLKELEQLADTAGLAVVGSTYQKLDYPNPRTYMASGKVAEVKTAVQALNVETVILDDEISPGQLRNLEKAFGDDVRVCDRTALILDIFSQRAATREAALQVELAQLEYQLPRLTKLWTHLERQAGGMVKGMGEKQIEVDKRILRTKIAELRKNLESVRDHRQQYRNRRASVPIPVISLVGYTNAGKSTLLNKLSNAGVLAEDKLFATHKTCTTPKWKGMLVYRYCGFYPKASDTTCCRISCNVRRDQRFVFDPTCGR